MKTERYFKKKIIKKIFEIFIFPIFVVLGLTFLTGFYYERNIYVKLSDITLELGDKLPEEITRYINLLTNDSNLTLETSVPLDEDGNTKMIGTFNYYLVYNDSSFMYSKLTNVKSTITVIDTVKPTIKVKDNVEIEYDSEFNLDDVAECIDLSGCKMTIKEEVDTTKSGDYEVEITAIDGGNNVSYAKTTFKVKEKPKPVYNYVSNYTLNIEQNNIKLNKAQIGYKNQIIETKKAIEEYNIKTVIIAGGVAANSFLREEMQKLCDNLKVDLSIPPMKYCTDNGTMIAAAGYFAYLEGRKADLGLNSKSQDTLK